MGAPPLTTKQLACSPSPDCVISVMCTQERASLIMFTSFPEKGKGGSPRPRRKDCVPTKNEMNSAIECSASVRWLLIGATVDLFWAKMRWAKQSYGAQKERNVRRSSGLSE